MPASVTDAELLDLCQRGQKIEAIRRRQVATGCSLLEAKQYVEALPHRPAAGLSQQPGSPGSVEQQVRRLCQAGHKLQAIKYYKEQTGADLRDAKSYVDAVEARLQPPPLPLPAARPGTPPPKSVVHSSTPLPPAAASPPRRHGLELLLGSIGLFVALTFAASFLRPDAGGAGTYGFPQTFYRAGAGAGPAQPYSLDPQALLLDGAFAFGATLVLYLLGRFLARRLRPATT